MLEKYRAVRFIKILESGRTRPVLLECEAADEVGAPFGFFVVKAPGLPEVGAYGLFVETLGYLLAGEFGVETPRPALIELAPEFVDTVNPVLSEAGLSIEPGIAFGSELIPGAVMVTGDEYQNPEQITQALNIFCYDLIVQNPDRLQKNPNCLIKNGRFIAFDFNMAFSFLTLIGKANEPWELSKHQYSGTHVFSRALHGKEVDFKPFINKVMMLSAKRLEEILEVIPFGDGRWNSKVREHVESVIENADKLEIEFARCLK